MPACARQNNPAAAIVPRWQACGAPVLSRHYAASVRPSSWRRGRPLLFCLVDDRQLRVHARAARCNDRARRLVAQDAMAPITKAARHPHRRRIRTAQVARGTFIPCRRSRGSQNRRGGDDGTRSLAVADRNSDPDHSVDLAVWRPSRVKCALSGSSACRQSSDRRLRAVRSANSVCRSE